MFAALPRAKALCCDRPVNDATSGPVPGLGLDAGGTATRRLLIDEGGQALARGEVVGFSATQLGTLQQPLLDAALAELSDALRALPRPTQVYGGLTGLDGAAAHAPGALHARMAQALGIAGEAVMLVSDIELACRASFEPGRGILVMAGTGSIAAHLRANGRLERAGGSGYWIAREALRGVWRREDAMPGAWQSSAMARSLFALIGGDSWAHTRASSRPCAMRWPPARRSAWCSPMPRAPRRFWPSAWRQRCRHSIRA